jgi:tyrosinase
MECKSLSRRSFVKGSVSALALTAIPARMAFGQTIRNRLEWNEFKQTSDYSSFYDAIRAMRANTNASDRASWLYWSNIHVNACPHNIPYFLAWHRGYLHYFQETLRTISGNSTLMVPYWDYYKNPVFPAEFTDASSSNPLYVEGRVNTNVRSALSLLAFSSTVNTFQRGTTNSFEKSVEYKPHGSFHNVVGGYMAKMNSPMDPIFWMHHGQIDRLWAAWVNAGAGRQYPPSTDSYWSGNLTYRSDLTMPRSQVFDTQTHLSYTYVDLALPKTLPPVSQAARIIRVQNVPGQGARRRPPLGRFTLTGPRAIGANRRSVGGAKGVALNENSVTAQIPVEVPDREALQAILERTQQSPFGPAQPPGRTYTSVQIVLDSARTTSGGANGGYFYDVYLNLPDNGNGSEDRNLLGSFGPFEIAAAQHHGGRLVFGATQVLQKLTPSDIRDLTVSFVRVSGGNSPRGDAVVVGELRAELSTDAIE